MNYISHLLLFRAYVILKQGHSLLADSKCNLILYIVPSHALFHSIMRKSFSLFSLEPHLQLIFYIHLYLRSLTSFWQCLIVCIVCVFSYLCHVKFSLVPCWSLLASPFPPFSSLYLFMLL